jgi:hypothetical protein
VTATAAPAAAPGAVHEAVPPAWLVGPDPALVRPQRRGLVHWLLRLATAGAFIGHGAYGAVVAKPGWYPFLARLGFDRAAVEAHALLRWAGGLELLLGLLVLVWPIRALLLFLFAWKLGSEFVWYPLTGLPAWEFVERWSNYAAPGFAPRPGLAPVVARPAPLTATAGSATPPGSTRWRGSIRRR